MKAWIFRGSGYYTVFPFQGPDIFWLSLQKIIEARFWAWTGSGKEHETGGKGAGHNVWKNDIAQGHNINRLKSIESKMTSQIQVNLILNLQAKWYTLRCQEVPSHCQKTKEQVVPQLLEWSSHSLAYEITQLTKTNHTTFHGLCTHPLWWPKLLKCASFFTQTNLNPLNYCCVSHWIFCKKTSRTQASLGPETQF